MNRNQGQASGLGQFLEFSCWILLLLIGGSWVVSQWLTRLLFKKVINPLFDDVLDRHEGLVILLSGTLWSGIFMILFSWLVAPEIATSARHEQLKAFWVFVGLGLAWGISIGMWILLVWWNEIKLRTEPVYEPSQTLGQGLKVVSVPNGTASSRLPSRAELKQDLAGSYLPVEKQKVGY